MASLLRLRQSLVVTEKYLDLHVQLGARVLAGDYESKVATRGAVWIFQKGGINARSKKLVAQPRGIGRVPRTDEDDWPGRVSENKAGLAQRRFHMRRVPQQSQPECRVLLQNP